MKVIGLTGVSGSGKTTVCEILSKLGAYIIDCDKIAHENMKMGNVAYAEIVATFGNNILLENGEINRKALGDIVFSHKEKLLVLNSITHKHIVSRVISLINEIKQKNNEYTSIIIDAPLLKEAGLIPVVDRVWVVSASEEKRVDRIIKRDNIEKSRALARLKYQNTDYEKTAHVIINNDFDNMEDLFEYVSSIYYRELEV